MSVFEDLAKNLDINLKSETPETNPTYQGSERLIAALSYVYFVSPAVLLFSTNTSGFVKLHAKHALVLLLLSVLGFLVPNNLIRYPIIAFCLLVIVVCALRAAKGKTIFIPFVTPLLQDFEI